MGHLDIVALVVRVLNKNNVVNVLLESFVFQQYNPEQLKTKIMKTVFGIGLIILGVVSIFRYPNLGVSIPETIGALLAVGVLMLLPGILLIRSDNKNKVK